MLNVGLIGCGNISNAYLSNNTVFPYARIVKCADMREDAAKASAEKYGLKAVSVDALFNDPEIDIILNLTTPESHTAIDLRALESGKHVYSEKPFALSREDGLQVLRLAEKKGLRVGCAPDTFLGGGHQACRELFDSGMVGDVVGGCAIMACPGHESWHPAPGFYYKKGGGPLLDMGPYYITALVNLLGPVKRVAALNTRSGDIRQGVGVNLDKTFPVEVDTHISAVLEFGSGIVVNMIMSFDTLLTSPQMKNCIELWGLGGALRIPDPNAFSGNMSFCKRGLTESWTPAANKFSYNGNMRLIGLADMAAGIEKNRPHRCSGELAYHVLDVMLSIIEASDNKQYAEIESTCSRPAPLLPYLLNGNLD